MIAEYYETLVKAGQISLRKGKKKRKQPLVPQSAPHDEDRKTISYWSVSERQLFLVAFKQHGKGNWDKISAEITTKSAIQVRNYYHNSRTKPEVVQVEREIEERDRQDTPANDEPDTAQPVYDLSARNIMYLGGQSPTSNHPQPMSISIPPPHELQERGSTSPRKLEMSYILASGVSKRDEREIQRGPVRSNSVSVPHSEYDLDEESKRWKSDVGATSHPASTWPQPGLSPSKAAPLPFPAQKNVEYTILGTEHQNLSPAQKSPAGSPIITKPLSKRVRGRGRGRGGKSRQSKGDPAASHPVLSMTEQQSHFQVQVMQIVQQPEFVTKSKKGDVEKNVELQVEIDAGILLQNASSSQAHKDIKVDHLTADAALNSPTSITPLQPKLETAVTRLAIPALLKTPVKQGTMGHIEKKGPVGAVDMGAPTIGDSPTRIAETPATLPIREAKLARSPICAVQPESSPTHDVNAMKSPIRDLQPVPIREPQPVSSPTRDMKRAPSPLRAQQPVSSPSRASPTRSPLSKPPSASLSPKHTSPISSSTVLIPTVASAAAYSAASNSVGFGFGSGIGVKRPMSTIRSPQKHQEAEVQLQGLTSSLSKPGSNSSQHASENVVHAQLETSVTEPAPTGDTRVVPSRSDIDH